MFPYAAYTEDHCINVDINNIVWDAAPVKELYNQYNSAFGSGIQLAGL
jgi:phosphosulfolactate synthase (CoM biosynthesis protein A)